MEETLIWLSDEHEQSEYSDKIFYINLHHNGYLIVLTRNIACVSVEVVPVVPKSYTRLLTYVRSIQVPDLSRSLGYITIGEHLFFTSLHLTKPVEVSRRAYSLAVIINKDIQEEAQEADVR